MAFKDIISPACFGNSVINISRFVIVMCFSLLQCVVNLVYPSPKIKPIKNIKIDRQTNNNEFIDYTASSATSCIRESTCPCLIACSFSIPFLNSLKVSMGI